MEFENTKISKTTNEKYGMPVSCRLPLDIAWDITREARTLEQTVSKFSTMLLLRGWDGWLGRTAKENEVELEDWKGRALRAEEKCKQMELANESSDSDTLKLVKKNAVSDAFRDVMDIHVKKPNISIGQCMSNYMQSAYGL